MERQVTEDASSSKEKSKKGTEPWRCEGTGHAMRETKKN
jgi:hypothetical protein